MAATAAAVGVAAGVVAAAVSAAGAAVGAAAGAAAAVAAAAGAVAAAAGAGAAVAAVAGRNHELRHPVPRLVIHHWSMRKFTPAARAVAPTARTARPISWPGAERVPATADHRQKMRHAPGIGAS